MITWDNNVEMDLRGMGCDDMDWIHLAMVCSCEHSNEPLASIKGRKFLD
jgi:hypothetical protein